ncbi:MAG: hypothetical protein LBP75_03085 [Planctomycetota bacterium]|jgi:hypothetical protein|nr:hypothetical protein [Planctomycetota bacterium]
MDIRKSERGVAVIVAVALAVALLMLSVALLGTTRRHTDTSKSYRQTDMLQMALLSVKADAVYRLNDDGGDLTNAMKNLDLQLGATAGKNLYDLDGARDFVTPQEFADAGNEVSGFRPDAADFYKNPTGNYLDRKMNPTTAEQSIYELKTRAYLVPLDASFLVNWVRKFDGENYPFPGLFDGEAALIRNIVPLFTDVWSGYNDANLAHAADGNQDIYLENEFSLDDLINVDKEVVKSEGWTRENYFAKAAAHIVLHAPVTGADGEIDIGQTIVNKINDVKFDSNGLPYQRIEAADKTSILSEDSPIGEDSPYYPFTRLVKLAKDANDKYLIDMMDGARQVMNYTTYQGNTNYSAAEKIKIEADNTAYLTADANQKVKERTDFATFNEIGINFALLNQARGNAAAAYGVFTGSMPYNTVSFIDKNLLKKNDTTGELETPLRPAKIPLNANTPQWLIAAAIGWQLFNSPTAKARMAAQAKANYEGGAIYRIDLTAGETLAFVFDHRRMYNGDFIGDTGDLFITPFTYASMRNANTTVSAKGYANFYAYPLKYGGTINNTACRVEWSGWQRTHNLDLMAFAGGTTNSYVANGYSPFKKDNTYIDVRTNSFAGTGTYVRPSIQKDVNVGTGNLYDKNDIWYWGRMATFGNTLRTHNELPAIIDIVTNHLLAHKATNDVKIDEIIAQIYNDPRVGYDNNHPSLSRSSIARNPYEGTIIWALEDDHYRALAGTLTEQPANKTPTAIFEPTKTDTKTPATAGPLKSYSTLNLPPRAAASGGGSTGDRFSETYMTGNSNGGAAAWKRYVVDNVARDWDGTILWIQGKMPTSGANKDDVRYPANPTFGWSQRVPYAKEMNFQDWYFNTHPGNYKPSSSPAVDGSNYNDKDVTGNSGSNVQGYDVTQSANGYAEPVWYRTLDAYAPLSASATADSNGSFLSGPVFYCDASANGQKYISGSTINLTAPPYQHSMGRWDKRATGNDAEVGDVPGYKATIATLRDDSERNPTNPNVVASHLDPAKNGTLYRNDANKTTSLWRWNWGKWTHILNGPTKAGATTTTYVSENGTRATSPSGTGEAVARYGIVNSDGKIVSAFYAPKRITIDSTSKSVLYSSALRLLEWDENSSSAKIITQNNNGSINHSDNGGTKYSDALFDYSHESFGKRKFVMRPAYYSRWKPAIGSTYPMDIEINPQAVKNAAIERVVVNLFGLLAKDGNGKIHSYPSYKSWKTSGLTPITKLDYLVSGDADAADAYLRDNYDIGSPIFYYEPTDRFYRVIVAAGLIHTGKNEVVAKKFLQFVYRKNNGAGGAVVDNHLIDPE